MPAFNNYFLLFLLIRGTSITYTQHQLKIFHNLTYTILIVIIYEEVPLVYDKISGYAPKQVSKRMAHQS